MCRATTPSLSTKRPFSATINSMTATVEHIRKQIDNLAPDEARELLLDLQRSYAVPLIPSENADDDAEVEAAWEAEIDGRMQDVEEGRVQLLSAEESEKRTEALFTRLGIERPVHRP
jgi:hypothetical protein